MGIIGWAEKRTQALNMWDIGVLKIYCALFGVIIGAHMAEFVQANVGIFVLAVFVLWGGLAFRWLTAKPREDGRGQT
jgi:hypothetical protein